MSVLYAQPSVEGYPSKEENAVIWFSYPILEDSEHVVIIYEEKVLIMKITETISQSEFIEMVSNWEKWKQKFGVGTQSAVLRKLALDRNKIEGPHKKQNSLRSLLRVFTGDKELLLKTFELLVGLLTLVIAIVAIALGAKNWFLWSFVFFLITSSVILIKALISPKN